MCFFLTPGKLNGMKAELSNYRMNIQTPTNDNTDKDNKDLLQKPHNHVGKLKMQ